MSKLLGLYLLIFSVHVFSSEIEILKNQIEAANYCETKNDCVDLGAFCPISCNILVNKNEASEIKKKINTSKPTCVAKCWPIKEIVCEKNICKSIKDK